LSCPEKQSWVVSLSELVMAVLMVIVLIWRPNAVIGGQEITWPIIKRRR
jgi:branched-subunit amino acid ABC-type transport system permease component